MNERIRELARRVIGKHRNDVSSISLFDEQIEKFAELIVQECAKESRLAVQRAFDHGLTNTIPEYVEVAVCRHFGVG